MKLGTQELILILLIIVIVLGPTQIPKLTKMFGKATKCFKEGMAGDDADSESVKKTSSESAKDEA